MARKEIWHEQCFEPMHTVPKIIGFSEKKTEPVTVETDAMV